MLTFLVENAFYVAIAAWLLGAIADWIIRRHNNVRAQLLHNIALGGGGATHFVMMFLFGLSLLIDAEIAVLLQNDNPQLLGLAAILGACSLVWLYLTGDPYSPPRASVGQKLLKHLGYYNGDIDGHCGKRTRLSLRNFLKAVSEKKHGDKALDKAALIPWFARRQKNKDFNEKAGPKITNNSLLVISEAVIEESSKG